jgi:hypothetical protein
MCDAPPVWPTQYVGISRDNQDGVLNDSCTSAICATLEAQGVPLVVWEPADLDDKHRERFLLAIGYLGKDPVAGGLVVLYVSQVLGPNPMLEFAVAAVPGARQVTRDEGHGAAYDTEDEANPAPPPYAHKPIQPARVVELLRELITAMFEIEVLGCRKLETV